MNEGIKKFAELMRTDESFQTKLKAAPVVLVVMTEDLDVSLLALVLHMAAWVKGNNIILANNWSFWFPLKEMRIPAK